ncbi:MAG: bacillithiol system redox-active protein YtxJ [Bacteroidota bacterium]
MNWIEITGLDHLEEIRQKSFSKKQAIFKHSTRCSISSMIKSRLEREYDISSDDMDVYHLDLIARRDVSNQIEANWNVQHESPQLIVIESDKAIYHGSHHMIQVSEIKNLI